MQADKTECWKAGLVTGQIVVVHDDGNNRSGWRVVAFCLGRGHRLVRVDHLGLITMGEAWHNNHHTFPESARLGLKPGQLDPGWWAISLLRRLGLIKNVRLPENIPERKELHPVLENQRF